LLIFIHYERHNNRIVNIHSLHCIYSTHCGHWVVKSSRIES